MDFVNLSTSRKIEEIQKKSLWLYFIKFWRFVGTFLKVFWHLCTYKYDLCYLAITCYGTPFLKDYPFVMLCKLFHRPILIHQHNKGMSQYVDKWPYRWMLPRAYKETKVILLSQFLYPDIQRIVFEDQILLCPNGLTNNSSIKDIPSKDIVPHLLFLSNLIESKGIFILLEACKNLREKGFNFICDFVGSSTKFINEEVFDKKVENLNLKGVAFYHGAKYGKEKNLFWIQSSIFILPTFDDCFPLVILEAMQQHLPVVTTNEGGIPDIVIDGETGYICPTKDVEALTNAIEKLLKDPVLCQHMGEAGYTRYLEHFTIECFERQMVQCLHKAINS